LGTSAHTVEASLRGSIGTDAKVGLLTWGLGVYRTLSDDDGFMPSTA